MEDDKNKKVTRLNSIRGTQRFTKPSQTNDIANVQINTEIAIPKLRKLAQDYYGVTDPYGFLTGTDYPEFLKKRAPLHNSSAQSCSLVVLWSCSLYSA